MGKKRLMRLGYTLTIGVLSLAVVACGGDKNKATGGSTGFELPASFYSGAIDESYIAINILEVEKGFSPREIPVRRLPVGSDSYINRSIVFGEDPTVSEALTASSYKDSLLIGFAEDKEVEDALLLKAEVAGYTINVPLKVVPANEWVTFSKMIMNDMDGKKVSAATIDDAPLKNVEIGSSGSRGDHSLPARSGLFTFVFNDENGNGVTPSNPDVYVTNTNEEVFKTRLVQESNSYLLEVAPNAIEKTAVITLRSVENSSAVAVLNLKSMPSAPQIIPEQESGMYIPDNFDSEELYARFKVLSLPEGMKVKGVLSGTNDILEFKGIGGDEATIADGVATFTLVKGGTTRTPGNLVTLTATLVDESQENVTSNEDTLISAETTIKVVDVIVDKVGDAGLSAFCQGFNEVSFSAVVGFPLEAQDDEILSIISSTATGGDTSGGTEITDLVLSKIVVDTKAGAVVTPETADLDGKAVLTCVGNLPVGVPTFINGVTTVTAVDVTVTEGSATTPIPVISLYPSTNLTTNRDEIALILLDISDYDSTVYDVLAAEKPGGDPDDLLPEPGERGGLVVTERNRNEGASVGYTLGGSGSGTRVTIVITVVPEGETDTTNAIGDPLELELRMTYN